MSEERLTSAEYWEQEFWHIGNDAEVPSLEFDPQHWSYRELHKLLSQHVPFGPTHRSLEVGCHPGRFMWYFHHCFAHQVAGIEYVASACQKTRTALRFAGIPAEVFHADLFEFAPPEEHLWDLVASFGVVEHFRDAVSPIVHHARLIKPGGLLVLEIPNHSGMNGLILKAISPEVYDRHNHMSYKDLAAAVQQAGSLEIIAGGYVGRVNFSPSALYDRIVHVGGKRLYKLLRAPFRAIELAGGLLPNCRALSSHSVIIAKKTAPKLSGMVDPDGPPVMNAAA